MGGSTEIRKSYSLHRIIKIFALIQFFNRFSNFANQALDHISLDILVYDRKYVHL